MPKKIIQDVIPPESKKSIRNISLPEREVRKNKALEPSAASIPTTVKKTPEKTVPGVTVTAPPLKEGREPETIPATSSKFLYRKPNGKWRIVLIIVALILALSFGYLAYLFFHVGATITITTKERSGSVNNSFIAKRNPLPGEISFEVITLDESGEKTVPATGEKQVEKKATGTVVIYNDYDNTAQRLIKNTRLTTSDGKVYHLESSVVIPGQKKVDGKTTPGSLEVTVIADQPGENYNIPLSDFTIPGFKEANDPRYEKFYARSKTPMAGGFKGTIKTASSADREAAIADVSAELKSRIIKKAFAQIPSDFILYEKAAFVTYEVNSPGESNTISIKATLHGIIFDKKLLSSAIAKVILPQYNPEEAVLIPDLEKISFTPDSLEIAPWQTGALPFTLKGTTTVFWIIDEAKLKQDLVGIPKEKKDEIFKQYPGIERAVPNLQPVWKSNFPEDPEKIKIIIENNPLVKKDGKEEPAP